MDKFTTIAAFVLASAFVFAIVVAITSLIGSFISMEWICSLNSTTGRASVLVLWGILTIAMLGDD